MAGFSPPPPPPPYIGAADQGAVPLGTSSNPTLVRPGVGLIARVDEDAGELLLDGAIAQPGRDYHHFHPGALAAMAPLVEIADSRIGAEAVLQYIEANLLTAPPVGTDAANFYALVVSGSVSGGPATLPLNIAGQRRFSLDAQAPIRHGLTISSTRANVLGSQAIPMEYTSEQRVEAIELGANGAADNPAGRRRWWILDKLGKPLVYADTDYALPSGKFVVPLPYAVTLDAHDGHWGSSGFIVVEPLDGDVGTRLHKTNGSGSGDTAITGFFPPSFELSLADYQAGARWDDGRTFPDDQPQRKWTTGDHAKASSNGPGHMILSRTVGVPLKGDIVVDVTLTGAPGGAPEDMNLRIETSPSVHGE